MSDVIQMGKPKTCCLDCKTVCDLLNCRDHGKEANGKYAGWCYGSESDKLDCQGTCVYFTKKERKK